MKKISQLFKMNFETHKIENEINKGCEWVTKGEGMATRKYDGTACMILHGRLYKRYDVKAGRKKPENGIFCEAYPDPITGHWPCWILVTQNPEDKHHREAFTGSESDGTFELCGPKINGNPEGFGVHELVRHGIFKYPQCPRDFEGIKEFLIKEEIEGIVFYRDNGEMCKVKLKDYGIKMPKLKSNYICGFCQHYDSDNCYCMASGMHEIYEEDTCEYWEGEKDEPDFDLEYHDRKCEEKKGK